jgi:hypothetical protein
MTRERRAYLAAKNLSLPYWGSQTFFDNEGLR